MYIGKDGKLDEVAPVIGYHSVAGPGTVAGLELALKTYGTMKLADVMAPAIRLAEDGFTVSAKLALELEEERPGLKNFQASKRIFLNGGKMWKAGDTLKQAELAPTLKRIARNGAAEFYRRETAQLLASAMWKNSALVLRQDPANYAVRVRCPLTGMYATAR